MDVNMERLRNRLLAEQGETIEGIWQAHHSAAPVELDQSSMGRVSRIDALQQQALAQGLMERLVIRKRKIEAALARLDSSTYGLCCACHSDLERERLNADPAAVFCQECAAERQ